MPCRPDLATSDSWPPLGKVVTQGFGTMASRELGLSSILPFDLEIDNIPWQIGQNWHKSVGASLKRRSFGDNNLFVPF